MTITAHGDEPSTSEQWPSFTVEDILKMKDVVQENSSDEDDWGTPSSAAQWGDPHFRLIERQRRTRFWTPAGPSSQGPALGGRGRRATEVPQASTTSGKRTPNKDPLEHFARVLDSLDIANTASSPSSTNVFNNLDSLAFVSAASCSIEAGKIDNDADEHSSVKHPVTQRTPLWRRNGADLASWSEALTNSGRQYVASYMPTSQYNHARSMQSAPLQVQPAAATPATRSVVTQKWRPVEIHPLDGSADFNFPLLTPQRATSVTTVPAPKPHQSEARTKQSTTENLMDTGLEPLTWTTLVPVKELLQF